MKETAVFGLPYPEPEDFGNGALQLQAFAEAADTEIFGLQQAQIAAARKKALIISLSADVSISYAFTNPWRPYADGYNILSFNAFNVLYNNGFTAVSGSSIYVPESGSYMFGGYMSMIASGTVNVHTIRRQQIAAGSPSGAQLTSQKVYLYQQSCTESNLGGMFNTVMGVFDFEASPTNPGSPLYWSLYHQNSSSNVLVKAGSVFWVVKISELGS